MYAGKRYLKNPRQFLQRLQNPSAADSTKFVLDGLTEEDRKMLSTGLNKKQVDHLTSKIESILAKASEDQLTPLDSEVGSDGVCSVDEVLRQEYKQIFGDTLYVKDPEKLIAGDLGKFGQLFKAEEVTALKNAATNKDQTAIANGVRRITIAINDRSKVDRQTVDELMKAGLVGDLQSVPPYAPDEAPDGEAPRAPVNPNLIAALVRTQRQALCLSGGGIRSATFNLGLIQGLAQNGQLEQFDYLSTVSGGGFIGGWLSAWIKRSGLPKVLSRIRDIADPEEVRYLRGYSNYLAPKTGFLSPDTWVLVATYLRNLTVTWFTFIPFLLLALLAPRAAYAFTFGSYFNVYVAQDVLTLVEATLFALVGGAYISTCLPSVQRRIANQPEDIRNAQRSFMGFALVPLVMSAWLFSKLIWFYGGEVSKSWVVGLSIGIVFAGWLPGAWRLKSKIPKTDLVFITFVCVPGAALISGEIGYYPLRWLAESHSLGPELYFSFAPLVLLVLMLLTGTIIAAVISRATKLEDEEWWARSGAYFSIAIVGWASFSFLCLYAPQYLNLVDAVSRLFKSSPKAAITDVTGWLTVLAHAAGAATTIFAVLAGHSSKTGGGAKKGSGGSGDLWINGVSILAVGYIFIVLNLGLDRLLAAYAKLPGKDHFAIIAQSTMTVVLSTAAVFAVVLVLTQVLVNANKFTPHYFYRNRIVRAYLGASRPRKPDPFTGLDEQDNLSMYDLRGQRPFHVVNMALNLAGSGRLAWQERKAESFTATPLYSGSLWLGYRDSQLYGGAESKQKRPISLGTAVAVSGAAVSPNMGYMLNSAAAQFLLAMFAVRLGVWLGNPGKAGDRTFAWSAPLVSLWPILKEALGLTDEKGEYVYLSDGGHFENLGLYEMVMRGCSQIVVSDASTDDSYEFESLAVSIRKIRIDFGIPIEFETFGPIGHFDDGVGHYCALGRIRYSRLDPSVQDGCLLYIKASMRGGEPEDVVHYGTANPSFPQQTIADQFFTESQFESYRALAFHIVQKLGGGVGGTMPLASFIAGVKNHLSDEDDGAIEKLAHSALSRAAHG